MSDQVPRIAVQLRLGERAHALRRLIETGTFLANVADSGGQSGWASELRIANASHQQELNAVMRRIDDIKRLDEW